MMYYVSSVLFVEDITAFRIFYEKLLNQQVEIDYGVQKPAYYN